MKSVFTLIILFIGFLLSSCSFHLRNAQSFSPELNNLYFNSDKPFNVVSTQLRSLLESNQLHLAKKESDARFSLVISDDVFSYSRPDVVNASLPTTMNFIQTATATIEDNLTHKTIISQTFSTTQSLTLNANQIYTADSNDFMKRELTRNMVSLIYYWLISTNTKEAVHHAIRTKRIKKTVSHQR